MIGVSKLSLRDIGVAIWSSILISNLWIFGQYRWDNLSGLQVSSLSSFGKLFKSLFPACKD